MAHQARVGWGNPLIFGTTHRLRYTATPSTETGGITDLSVVTGGHFRVVRENGAVDIWLASLAEPAIETSAVLLYQFGAEDLTRAERIQVTPILIIPGNIVDAYPFTIYVIA